MQGLDELIADASVFAGLEARWLSLIAGCAVQRARRALASTCSARVSRPIASS